MFFTRRSLRALSIPCVRASTALRTTIQNARGKAAEKGDTTVVSHNHRGQMTNRDQTAADKCAKWLADLLLNDPDRFDISVLKGVLSRRK